MFKKACQLISWPWLVAGVALGLLAPVIDYLILRKIETASLQSLETLRGANLDGSLLDEIHAKGTFPFTSTGGLQVASMIVSSQLGMCLLAFALILFIVKAYEINFFQLLVAYWGKLNTYIFFLLQAIISSILFFLSLAAGALLSGNLIRCFASFALEPQLTVVVESVFARGLLVSVLIGAAAATIAMLGGSLANSTFIYFPIFLISFPLYIKEATSRWSLPRIAQVFIGVGDHSFAFNNIEYPTDRIVPLYDQPAQYVVVAILLVGLLLAAWVKIPYDSAK